MMATAAAALLQQRTSYPAGSFYRRKERKDGIYICGACLFSYTMRQCLFLPAAARSRVRASQLAER
jgi:hypothetical protein